MGAWGRPVGGAAAYLDLGPAPGRKLFGDPLRRKILSWVDGGQKRRNRPNWSAGVVRPGYIRWVPVYRLPGEPVFPDPARAEPDGLLAVGGDLSPERLLSAYAAGIFPWYGEDSPILWWSPDPRLVLEPGQAARPRSLQRTIRQGRYRVTPTGPSRR